MAKHVIWVGAAGSTTGFGIIRSAIDAFGDDLSIVSADTNPPHLVAASILTPNFVQVPFATAPEFQLALIEGFTKFGVDTYIPVHDEEIMVAALNRENGIFPSRVDVLTPKVASVMRCNDKLLTYTSLVAADIPTPLTISLKDANWRENGWVVKPRFGVGSVGVRLLKNEVDFLNAKKQGDNLIVQTPCIGREITIDVFRSRKKDFFRAVARERIETKAGVCSKARIFHDNDLELLAKKIAYAIELTGAFNFQVMRDDRGYWSVIDINPRTGGATSMCGLLGIHFAAANIADLWGDDIEHLLPPLSQEHYVVRQPVDFLTR